MTGLILTPEELAFTRKCMAHALEKGVQKIRVTASKSTMDLIATLNGDMDKVTHCMDRSISIAVFVDGRYGTFATNRFDEESLDGFLDRAISTTRMLAEDRFRDLPALERTAKDAVTGLELNLYDDAYETMTPEKRLQLALDASLFGKKDGNGKWTLISEEGEYSDSVFDTYVIDSGGLECRHIETSFEYGVEMTVEDSEGDKYSGYWWDGTPKLKDLTIGECCPEALRRAVAQIGPKSHRGGKFNMVIDSEVASKVVSPVLRALNAYAIQQNNSFMTDSIGKKIFPEGLSIMDCCRNEGETGSRYFDSEGVATVPSPIVEKGTVRNYFINTYMAGKTGMAPTIEDAIRPKVMPYPQAGLRLKDILKMCGSGIYVTDFNGGNSNSSTGDFSYGVEGFAFKDGRITHPVREMVVTGNFLTLWSHLIACGDDARLCMSKLIPTLAFSDVDFSS